MGFPAAVPDPDQGLGDALPEGHTLHRMARTLRELEGRRLEVRSPQGKFAEAAARLDGRRMTDVEAYGKHLFVGFGAESVHVHLGLQGKLLSSAPPRPPLRSARLRLAVPEQAHDLVAPRVCELVDGARRDEIVASLGPDPIRADADPARAWAEVARRREAIGATLLDQGVFAGVGNVFRAEVLFLLGLDPMTPARALGAARFGELWRTLVDLMVRAMREGRIVSVPGPTEGLPEEQTRYVYKQASCRRCGTEVRAWPLAGRTMYTCPRCQPAHDAGTERSPPSYAP